MKNHHGFSLSEFLVVMTLSAIVLGIGIPSYNQIIANYRVRIASQQLTNAIHQAKECAVHYQNKVILCGSSNGIFCDGKWTAGQIIMNKETKKVFSVFPELPRGISVSWRSNLGHNEHIIFTPIGLPEGQWGSFWIESNYTGVKRIIVNSLGRVS